MNSWTSLPAWAACFVVGVRDAVPAGIGVVDVILPLVAITFVAAVVNGAVGYGFSSVSVPSGLMITTQRVLNPVLVLVEVVLNGVSVVLNRRGLRGLRPVLLPLIVGLMPGVALGAALVGVVAVLPLKTVTFALLLPLCVAQLVLRRRAHAVSPEGLSQKGVDDGRRLGRAGAGAAFGFGLGALYGTTTLSGPPLVLFLSRQRLDQDGFRAAMAAVRLAESSLAAIAYAVVGLLHRDAAVVALCIVPSVAVGLPIGRRLARGFSPATFQVLVLGLDVSLITIGLAVCLRELLGLSLLTTGVSALGIGLTAVASAHLILSLRQRVVRVTP